MEIRRKFNASWTTGKEKRRVVQNQFLLVGIIFHVHPNINGVEELSGHGWLLGLKHKYVFFYVKSV